MHQQVRLSRPKARRDGSMADERNIAAILTLLTKWNLRSVGRTYLGDGGEFVFSVRHEEGDDQPDHDACDHLNAKGDYGAEVYTVESDLLDDHEGALLEYINAFEKDKKHDPVIEVHILTPEDSGQVPVQLVTRSMLKR
jgi:hypothetical protein